MLISFGTQSGVRSATGSATVNIGPWERCPTITVTPQFKGQQGAPVSKENNYVHKTAPEMRPPDHLLLTWSQSDRNTLLIDNRGIANGYDNTLIYELTVDGNEMQTFRAAFPAEIKVNESTGDHARWTLTAMIEGTDLKGTVSGHISLIPNRKPEPAPTPSPSQPTPTPSPSPSGQVQSSGFLTRGGLPHPVFGAWPHPSQPIAHTH